MTQIEMTLRHLRDYGSITTWEAIKNYGITRISDKIYNLRKKGYNIASQDIEFTNRYGNKGKFCRYILKGDESDEAKRDTKK